MDKLLFTPGPLTTSKGVKEAMLTDVGSRDHDFITCVEETRNDILDITGLKSGEGFEAVIMQGSGTFGVESVLTCAVPRSGKLLILVNGVYGKRFVSIAKMNNLDYCEIRYNENQIIDIKEIEYILVRKEEITHVAVVHCETTTGIVNPIDEIGAICKKYNKLFIVDAMSSFGAIPIDLIKSNIHFLISSSNKCIEGVPGFSIVIADRLELFKTKGNSRTLCLDLYEQWDSLETTGQFRYTPPTHAILAFKQALKELKMEGGVEARGERYRRNNELLVSEMESMGFKLYLPEPHRGYIITSFLYPEHPKFNFELFYKLLSEHGFIIYPGKLTQVDCFRIGNIGQLYPTDIESLTSAISSVIKEMEVEL